MWGFYPSFSLSVPLFMTIIPSLLLPFDTDNDVNRHWFAIKINWPPPSPYQVVKRYVEIPFYKPQSFGPNILNLFNLIICYETSVVVAITFHSISSLLTLSFLCESFSCVLYSENTTWNGVAGSLPLYLSVRLTFATQRWNWIFTYFLLPTCSKRNTLRV